MTVVVAISAAMLVLAALMTLVRMTSGPTILDRIVALDVITAVIVGGLATEAVLNRHSDTVPILVVLSLVGFVGPTSVARFAAGKKREGDT